jgi:hypothetical protein
MKHYKDPITNELYAYEADGSQDAFIKDGLVAITDVEADAIRAQQAQAAEAALTYAEKRVREYPSIGDQLDALWKGGDAAAEMLAAVQAVKAKYPKGA